MDAPRILVVDAASENLAFIEAVLTSEEYQVDLAQNGEIALAKIAQCSPQLILSGVIMPVMDGVELTRRIRSRQSDNYIPILLITAPQQSNFVEGLDAGADDFIRKPVETDELLARVRLMLRLKNSIDKQKELARQREDFVSCLTHDLRTPLVAAERMLDLLKQESFGTLSKPAAEAVQLLWTNNTHVLQLANNLLEVYRYEAGYKQLNFIQINLKELIQETVQTLQPLASEKGLELVADLDDLEVSGSRLELQRVLINLVNNAIKFTDAGHIKLTLKPQTDVDVALITVEDTGIGMDLVEQAALFNRFQQGGHQRSGSGLGLYLSRQIIEAHSGCISLKSQPGKGSTFTVHLPRAVNASSDPASPLS